MRVASKTIYDVVQKNLSNITEDMFKTNKMVATGKRINDLSDDPVGLMQVLNIKSSLKNIEQLGRNINMGTAWLDAADSALSHVQDLVSESRTLAVRMASATSNSDQRSAAANNVQNILEEVVSLGNTQVSGKYIFSGSRTGTTAFDNDGTYNGNSSAFLVKVGRSSTVAVGTDGQEVFGTVFSSLQDLKTGLENNNVDLIANAMDKLSDDFSQLSSQQSEIGSKTLRMEIKEKIFLDLQLTSTERLSAIEDADMAEAITHLQSQELIYKAALTSSAKIMNLSLVDFVR
jgi:flagellar hook-associated protein 3 FlgL